MQLGQLLLDVLERMNWGGFILSESGEVLLCNQRGQLAIAAANSEPAAVTVDLRRYFVGVTYTASGDGWVVAPREGRRQIISRTMPLRSPAAGGPATLLLLIDLELDPIISPGALQAIFDFEPAEADLAVAVAAGKTLSEVADAQGVTMAVARGRLARVLSKTGTRRQADLIRLLTRLCLVP